MLKGFAVLLNLYAVTDSRSLLFHYIAEGSLVQQLKRFIQTAACEVNASPEI